MSTSSRVVEWKPVTADSGSTTDRRFTIVIGVVVLSLAGIAGFVVFGGTEPDPCELRGSRAALIDSKNSYLFGCDGKVYVETTFDNKPFRRVPGLSVSEIEVLPFSFAR